MGKEISVSPFGTSCKLTKETKTHGAGTERFLQLYMWSTQCKENVEIKKYSTLKFKEEKLAKE